jgi:hypothetical protein
MTSAVATGRYLYLNSRCSYRRNVRRPIQSPVPICRASKNTDHLEGYLLDVLHDCVAAHDLVDEVGPVPKVIAGAWGLAWTARFQELNDTISLSCGTSVQTQSSKCELTLVGIFHRDAVNLRFVRAAADASNPEAVAVEARATYLDSYLHLAESLPDELLTKLVEVPGHNLQVRYGTALETGAGRAGERAITMASRFCWPKRPRRPPGATTEPDNAPDV